MSAPPGGPPPNPEPPRTVEQTFKTLQDYRDYFRRAAQARAQRKEPGSTRFESERRAALRETMMAERRINALAEAAYQRQIQLPPNAGPQLPPSAIPVMGTNAGPQPLPGRMLGPDGLTAAEREALRGLQALEQRIRTTVQVTGGLTGPALLIQSQKIPNPPASSEEVAGVFSIVLGPLLGPFGAAAFGASTALQAEAYAREVARGLPPDPVIADIASRLLAREQSGELDAIEIAGLLNLSHAESIMIGTMDWSDP